MMNIKKMRKKCKQTGRTLSHKTEIRIRFSEVDSMAIVWHGSYVKYFEDGREKKKKKYNLGYMDVYRQNYMTPLVKFDINYKTPLVYEDEAIIKTTFVDNPAAKIIFEYEIRNKKTNAIVATGETIQIFMNTDRKLELTTPTFFENWKKENLK